MKKIDGENSKPIKDVEFQLLNTNGTQIATAKTNEQGIVTFNGLYQGDYKLKEIKTGKEYILNSEVFDIKVEYDKTTNKTIKNYPKKGNLKINKTDSETSKPIEGVTFELLDSKNNVVASGTTDKNGELNFQDLRIGKYKLKETKTNENYILNKMNFDVEIEYNKTVVKNIKNDYKKGNIKINKSDSETSEPIEGVTFELLDLQGNVVATATTNQKGEADFKNLKMGKYRLKETKTRENYILNEAIFDVEVEYNQTTIQDIQNECKKGKLVINKVDKDNHKIGIGNVLFDLFSNELNKIIGTYTTDVDGQISINDLRVGAYKLIERTTGKWYEFAKDIILNINWKETTHVLVENELKKGQVKIVKTDKQNKDKKLQGVEFEIIDEKGEILEKVITDKNGEALTSKYAIRDFAKIRIRESKTIENYIIAEDIQEVKLKENETIIVVFENEQEKPKKEQPKKEQPNKVLPKTGF